MQARIHIAFALTLFSAITPSDQEHDHQHGTDLHLAVGHFPAARAAYLKVLIRERGRARALFGAARAAELAGDKATAAKEYRTFLAQMEHADGRRAEREIARAGAR
jgi:hypothetical protein